jgi:hypothetical protein
MHLRSTAHGRSDWAVQRLKITRFRDTFKPDFEHCRFSGLRARTPEGFWNTSRNRDSEQVGRFPRMASVTHFPPRCNALRAEGDTQSHQTATRACSGCRFPIRDCAPLAEALQPQMPGEGASSGCHC